MITVCADDYAPLARAKLSDEVWDFVTGGSGDELTLDANRRAFAQMLLRPRVLVDVTKLDTMVTLFGAELAAPIGVAPTAYHRLVHEEGEVATARGAGEAGALYVVSIMASRTIEEIAAAATGPLWMQLYWFQRRDALVDIVTRAERAGFRALVLTVDAPQLGRRRRDVRNAFAVDPSIRAVNLAPELVATANVRKEGSSAVAAQVAESFDASITWADLAWLKSITTLPLLVKGVLTAEDATFALEHGVDGIIVSNHGGRQLDGAVPAITALPQIAAAVGGRCPVLVDGGVRTGRDILISLALGADAVLIGRPVLYALAAAGADGVRDLLHLLADELAHTMALMGRRNLSDIGPDCLAR